MAEDAKEAKEEKVRLGGMALANGVLVHGPTSWAVAVRTEDGDVKVVAERKRVSGSKLNQPLLRGPARLVESVAFLPRLKRALPEAKLPFEGRAALASMVGTAVAISAVRRSKLSAGSEELVAGILSVAPADPGVAQRIARRLPRRRAHRDRHLRAGSADDPRARTLRRPPDGPAARHRDLREPARYSRAPRT